jgi:expansin (peptidoglycan-binding protein)
VHRRWLFMAAATALIVASVTLVLLPDHRADTGHAAATPAAGSRSDDPSATASPTATRRAADASAKPSAEATARKPSTRTSTGPATPRARDTPQVASGTAPLAGRIRPGATYRGVATFYGSDGTGACLYDASSDVMTGAMNHTDYETAKACGAYVRVRAANGASITVRITNECPGECAPGQIDLSAQAFAKLAAPSAGRIPITWKLVSPGAAGQLSIRYKTGSTRYWCGIQVVGHRNPLARLEVGTGSGWRRLERTDYNYFLSEDGNGCGGPIRITDIFGERLTVNGIAIRANVVQPARVQFARH